MARPRKLLTDKYLTPARQFGRVAGPDWDTLQRAAKAEGMTLTAWLLSVTLPRAKKILAKKSPQKHGVSSDS
jgi:hypothetical protein